MLSAGDVGIGDSLVSLDVAFLQQGAVWPPMCGVTF